MPRTNHGLPGSFSSTMNGSTPQPVLNVPLQMGCFPAQRYFLENVKSALAEGEFYVDHEAGHLFVWPKPEWKRRLQD